jgi:Lrp/AsnC family transcriptional regulator, leucine-responsive regulatory protein
MLDKISAALLRCLQSDSRQTLQQLADRVGLSPTPCWRRIKALEQNGIVRSYTVLLDRDKLGLGFCALATISLTRHAEGSVDTFEAAMKNAAEVVECYGTTGDGDYVIKVLVADAKAYDAFLHEKIFKLGVVSSIRSNIALREVKYQTALPV